MNNVRSCAAALWGGSQEAGKDGHPICRMRSRGSATAEFAVALPAVIMVIGIAIGLLSAGVQSLRCAQAAREIARAYITAADESFEAIALSAAGKSADFELIEEGKFMKIIVRQPLLGVDFPGFPKLISAEAVVLAQ